jgi:hypothetical protein
VLLTSDRAPWFAADDRAVLAAESAPGRVYRDLDDVFRTFFDAAER